MLGMVQKKMCRDTFKQRSTASWNYLTRLSERLFAIQAYIDFPTTVNAHNFFFFARFLSGIDFAKQTSKLPRVREAPRICKMQFYRSWSSILKDGITLRS